MARRTCLVLAASTIEENLANLTAERYAPDLVELRADYLSTASSVAALDLLAKRLREVARRITQPTILTIRRPADGGAFAGSEADRLELVRQAGTAFDYVDLEVEILRVEEGNRLAKTLRDAGVVVICSHHDFAGMPERPIAEVCRELLGYGDIAKLAVTPRSTTDLLALHRAADAVGASDREFVLLGMGSSGLVTRVLPERFGSMWTYAAPPGGAVAPGQVSLSDLNELYRFSDIKVTTPTFAVVADPVMHSRSPHYHNPAFRAAGVDAVYVPLHVDEFGLFPQLAERLDLIGASVTVPHKPAAAQLASREASDAVRALGVANTLLRNWSTGDWRAENTDVAGFLAGLADVPTHATVLGAGGSTRAVVYALLSRGVALRIVNRTFAKAQAIAADAALWFADPKPRIEVDPMPEQGGAQTADLGPYRQLIVNTTSLGMAGGAAESADPAAWYSYRGDETCYDIVYTPAVTPFLDRAQQAGCTTIGGATMFDAQAAAQQELFRQVYAARPRS